MAGISAASRQVDERAMIFIRALTNPDHLFTRNELGDLFDLVPKTSGLYAWYFDHRMMGVPIEHCHAVGSFTLLYVGISPSRSGSSGTLRSRLRYHFKGNSSGSTLRFTLACLLATQIGHDLEKVGARIRLSNEGELRLSEWMARHARVCWFVHAAPWTIEARVIKEAATPLNLAHNRHHPYYKTLRAIREEVRARAVKGTGKR